MGLEGNEDPRGKTYICVQNMSASFTLYYAPGMFYP